MTDYFQDWMARRIDVAERLANGECGGSDVEAHLILGALISGVASLLWPGKGIDRQRFTQVWHKYSVGIANANLVSLPLLIQELDRKGYHQERDSLIATKRHALELYPVSSDLVISGEDVDLPESEVKRTCPMLPYNVIRSNGYAALYYTHVRSGIVHEYKISSSADNWPFVSIPIVSYTNHLRGPNRRIHFPTRWISTVVRSIAVSADSDVDAAPLLPPKLWWLSEDPS